MPSDLLDPSFRQQRGRIGALAMSAQGRTNTAPARAALEGRFLEDVDPTGELRRENPQEALRRAEAARKLYYARLSYAAAKAKAARKREKPVLTTLAEAGLLTADGELASDGCTEGRCWCRDHGGEASDVCTEGGCWLLSFFAYRLECERKSTADQVASDG